MPAFKVFDAASVVYSPATGVLRTSPGVRLGNAVRLTGHECGRLHWAERHVRGAGAVRSADLFVVGARGGVPGKAVTRMMGHATSDATLNAYAPRRMVNA